jgi:hypothetical protein
MWPRYLLRGVYQSALFSSVDIADSSAVKPRHVLGAGDPSDAVPLPQHPSLAGQGPPTLPQAVRGDAAQNPYIWFDLLLDLFYCLV